MPESDGNLSRRQNRGETLSLEVSLLIRCKRLLIWRSDGGLTIFTSNRIVSDTIRHFLVLRSYSGAHHQNWNLSKLETPTTFMAESIFDCLFDLFGRFSLIELLFGFNKAASFNNRLDGLYSACVMPVKDARPIYRRRSYRIYS